MINKIHCENCIKTMQRMPDGFIDLIVTSPPYDNLRSYNGYNFDFKPIAIELFRVIKQGGVVVWVVGDQTIKGSETGTSFKQALFFKEIGFNLHDTMIYQKNSLSFPETNRYYPCFEYMFILSKGKPSVANLISDKKNTTAKRKISGKERNANGILSLKTGEIKKREIKENSVRWNVWKYETGYMKSYKEEYLKSHPAILPLELAADHIISWSNESDLVYDPFMGSGTTAIAAIKNNRNWIGSEISQEYCMLIEKRISNLIK